jgi:hypothetical protein
MSLHDDAYGPPPRTPIRCPATATLLDFLLPRRAGGQRGGGGYLHNATEASVFDLREQPES